MGGDQLPGRQKTTLTAGATAYIYPERRRARPQDANTVEIYGKAAFDVPLSPKLAVWYDVDKIKGAYFEGSISHTLPREREGLGGARRARGVQRRPGHPGRPDTRSESFNFADNGFTHLDLRPACRSRAGVFSITPALHVVINGDDVTKFTSPDQRRAT